MVDISHVWLLGPRNVTSASKFLKNLIILDLSSQM